MDSPALADAQRRAGVIQRSQKVTEFLKEVRVDV